MARIRTIDEGDATGEIGEFYRDYIARSGYPRIANILKVQSLSPATLKTHYEFYRSIMFAKGPLTRAQRELIAVAVSQANSCHY